MSKLNILREACDAALNRQEAGWFANFLTGKELRTAIRSLVQAWTEIDVSGKLSMTKEDLATANVGHLLPVEGDRWAPPELSFKIRDEKRGVVYVWTIDLMHGTASGSKWGSIKAFEKWLSKTPYGWEVPKSNARRVKVKA